MKKFLTVLMAIMVTVALATTGLAESKTNYYLRKANNLYDRIESNYKEENRWNLIYKSHVDFKLTMIGNYDNLDENEFYFVETYTIDNKDTVEICYIYDAEYDIRILNAYLWNGESLSRDEINSIYEDESWWKTL